jgi:hypothetical protein
VTAERGEWGGAALALLLHVALIAAMSTSLATIGAKPEPPAMEVELVDEIALDSAAPQAIPTPASEPPPAAEPAPPEPAPAVTPPPPQPRAVAQPTARPRPQPPRPQARPAPRPARPGIGDDFLKSLDDDLAPRNAPARPAAPVYNATARASIASSIAAQAQRCADREPFIGEGADRVRLTIRLNFARSGRLAGPPRVTGMAGDSEHRAKYGDLLEDQVRRIFTDCAPFRLPADLYDTDDGGWKQTTITYRVKQ